jgi:hypothetical protein
MCNLHVLASSCTFQTLLAVPAFLRRADQLRAASDFQPAMDKEAYEAQLAALNKQPAEGLCRFVREMRSVMARTVGRAAAEH